MWHPALDVSFVSHGDAVFFLTCILVDLIRLVDIDHRLPALDALGHVQVTWLVVFHHHSRQLNQIVRKLD